MKQLYALALSLGFSFFPANAQDARTALVIGCTYPNSSLELPSPVRDARALQAKLGEVGFSPNDVTLLSNPTRKQMLDAIDQFGNKLEKRGGLGLFYFSGHGAQFEGENFLIPAQASLGFREDLPSEAITAQRVVTRMEAAGNRVNLLFLDACRNNGLPSSRRKAVLAEGLGGMNAVNGMLIGFATARNSVANDSGEGSVYTNALLRQMATPGLSVTDMLTRVNADVRQKSGGSQIPFMESGLSDVFVLVPQGATMPPRPESKTASSVSPDGASREAPFVNSLGMEFVPLPGTKVLMCRTPTRVKDFQVFAEATAFKQSGGADIYAESGWKVVPKATWKSPGFTQKDDHPVVCVNWDEAQQFCRWLSAKEGLHYRLPKDEEWSVGVGNDKYPWGKSLPPPPDAGNFNRNGYFLRTTSVTAFRANALNLFDMGGNVEQWCEDIYRNKMNSAETIKMDPVMFKREGQLKGVEHRVVRGSSWFCRSDPYVQSATRFPCLQWYREDELGFRCALVLQE